MQERVSEVCYWTGRVSVQCSAVEELYQLKDRSKAEAPGLEPRAIKLHGGPFYVRRPRVRQCNWVNPVLIDTLYTQKASLRHTQMEFFAEAFPLDDRAFS